MELEKYQGPVIWGLGGITITVFCISMYNWFFNYEEPQNKENIEEVHIATEQEESSEDGQDEAHGHTNTPTTGQNRGPDDIEDKDSEEIKTHGQNIAGDVKAQFLATLFKIEEKERTFGPYNDLNAAKDILKILYKEDNSGYLRIGFDKRIFLDHYNEEELYSWLARVGDYIYAKRLLLIQHPKYVIRNSDLRRITYEQIEDFGNIRIHYDEEEGHRLWIDIRGLDGHVGEINFVAKNIILPAIENPQDINIIDEQDEVWDIFEFVKSYTLTEFKLSKHQENVIKAFFSDLTLSDDFYQCEQGEYYCDPLDTLWALFPLNKFNIPFTPEDQDILTIVNCLFAQTIYQNFIEKIKDIKITNDNFDQEFLNFYERKDENGETDYDKIMTALKSWSRKSRFHKIILNSLFRANASH